MKLADLRRNNPAFNGKGANACQNIAAILCIGNNGLIDENLKKQIIDIHIGAGRFADDGDFAGQRMRPAQPIDLPRVWRAPN